MCYSFIFQVIKTETSEDHFTVDASDEQSCNWMRFVNCAHSEDQQNLVSFQQGGRYIKELTLEKDLSSVHSVENALRKVQLLLGIYERTRPILTNHSSVAIAENALHVWPIFTYIKQYTLVKSHTNVTNVERVFD